MKSILSSTILSILLVVCALVQTSFANNDVDVQNNIVRRRAALKKVRARGNNQEQNRILSSKSSKSPKSMKSSKSPKSMKSGSSKMPKAMMNAATAAASSDGTKMENVMTVAALSTAAYFML